MVIDMVKWQGKDYRTWTAALEAKGKRIEELEGALQRIATRDYNETAQEFARAALKDGD